MLRLAERAGCQLEVLTAHKSQPDFHQRQEEVWAKVRLAMDNAFPCYGWELEIPEFYVVDGYDQVGYHFRGPGCSEGKGPLAWQSLGDTGIGVLEMIIVRPAQEAPIAPAVRDALSFAVEMSRNPKSFAFPDYRMGLAGYDQWIKALKKNRAGGFGMAYNAAVWSECRRHAVDFLREVHAEFGPDVRALVRDATVYFEEVSRHLNTVAAAFPFLNVSDEQKEDNVRDRDRREAAAEALRDAREHEEMGLQILSRISKSL
jgi:hypothetical protein